MDVEEQVNGPVKFCLQIHPSYLGGSYGERKHKCRSSLLWVLLVLNINSPSLSKMKHCLCLSQFFHCETVLYPEANLNWPLVRFNLFVSSFLSSLSACPSLSPSPFISFNFVHSCEINESKYTKKHAIAS